MDEDKAYTVKGWGGIAWTKVAEEGSRVVMVMVGDNKRQTFPESDITEISEEEYCGSCGQVGCSH